MMTIPKAVLYNKYTASLFNGATIERESYDYSRRQATVKIQDELDLYFFPTSCGSLGDLGEFTLYGPVGRKDDDHHFLRFARCNLLRLRREEQNVHSDTLIC